MYIGHDDTLKTRCCSTHSALCQLGQASQFDCVSYKDVAVNGEFCTVHFATGIVMLRPPHRDKSPTSEVLLALIAYITESFVFESHLYMRGM